MWSNGALTMADTHPHKEMTRGTEMSPRHFKTALLVESSVL